MVDSKEWIQKKTEVENAGEGTDKQNYVLLQRIWEQQSDMRFNKLISNLQHMYSSQNEGYGQRMLTEKGSFGEEVKYSYFDFFYLEDDKWEKFLQRMVDGQEKDYKQSLTYCFLPRQIKELQQVEER